MAREDFGAPAEACHPPSQRGKTKSAVRFFRLARLPALVPLCRFT